MTTQQTTNQNAFTLLELLVVIAIIALLTSILLPSLAAAKDLSRAAVCLSTLRGLGSAGSAYQADNDGHFWPYRLGNHPNPGVNCYFWGTDADPVDPSASPFMPYVDNNLAALGCPSLPWGSYVPQGAHVSQPTTTYGYNASYLDPSLNGTDCRQVATIPQPTDLFVFADSGMAWKPAGVWIFQNSTYLEPVSGSWVQMPTNHFRHDGRTQALCADGHAEAFGPEGWDVDGTHRLGFVGSENYPHYAQ